MIPILKQKAITMQLEPHSLVISDLHLGEQEPQITALFLRFLQNVARQAEALYILGDLFEFWIGDDDLTPYHQSIISALKQLTAEGIKLFIIRGNRDFLLGPDFMHASGAQLLPEGTLVNFYGTRTLLAHGDSLCTDDRPYQRYRRIVQRSWVQRLFLHLPLAWRRSIAQKIRRRSSRQGSYQDVNPSAVEAALQHVDAALLIHGHTHRLAVHFLKNHKQRWVLGAWHDSGSYIRLSDNRTEISQLR